MSDADRVSVLVTGANGFLGRSVTRFLRSRELQVRRAVRDLDGEPGSIAVGDLAGLPDWSAAVDGIDVVVHLAGRSHVLSGAGQQAEARLHDRVNAEATGSLLRACTRAGVRRVIFASTVKVHGESSGEGLWDASSPLQATGSYARSKVRAEETIQAICSTSRLQYCILRLPLVYGAGVKGNLLRLLRWVEGGWPLPLAGVRARRSLVGVDVVARIITRCLTHERATDRCFVVSDGPDLTVPEIIRALAEGMQRPARLLPCPAPVLETALRLAGRRNDIDRVLRPLRIDSRELYEALQVEPGRGTRAGLIEMARAFAEHPWGRR